MYKIWVFRIIKLISMYILSMVIVTVILDPYGEYNLISGKFNKLKFSTSHSTFPFTLYEKLKNDKYILVFGTSRSQLINKNMVGENILNFSSSLYGNPIDVYSFLSQLNLASKKNIIEIWYLIDTHTMVSKDSLYEKVKLDSKKDYILQTVQTFNSHKVLSSVDMVKKNVYGNTDNYISQYGENIKNLDANQFNGKIGKGQYYRIPAYNKKALKYLSSMDKWGKKNSIKIKFFTPIYNIPYLKLTDLLLYKMQYNQFLTAIDGFYDFHYVAGISEKLEYFSDIDHINTKGTKKLVEMLKTPNAKYFTTRDNVAYSHKGLLDSIKSH